MAGAAPVGSYYNSLMTPSALLGIQPGKSGTAAGQTLPPTSNSGNDQGAVPWHPDSETFWLLVVAGLTVLGVTGASVRVRAFKRRGSLDLGDS